MGVRGPSRSRAGDGVGFAIPAFKRQRQKHHHTYRASLVCMVSYRSADDTEETLSPNTNNERANEVGIAVGPEEEEGNRSACS